MQRTPLAPLGIASLRHAPSCGRALDEPCAQGRYPRTTSRRVRPCAALVCSGLIACNPPGADGATASLGGADTGVDGHGPTSGGDAASAAASGVEASLTADTAENGDSNDPKFDVGDDSGGVDSADTAQPPSCKVVDEMDAVGQCDAKAPADSFEPGVQWSWAGQDGYVQSVVIALVANLTDDNADGEIDLCDVPDVLVNAFATYGSFDGYLFLLDGERGMVHWRSDQMVDGTVTPAIGDLDGDGVAEIVAVSYPERALVGVGADGTTRWTGSVWNDPMGAIALADVDNDGDVEIVAGNTLHDHTGELIVTMAGQSGNSGFGNATVAADLDGDDDLELVLGPSAFHHDGTPLYQAEGLGPGIPQVADLDDDPEPEVLMTNVNGITVLEHDGAEKYRELRPTGEAPSYSRWHRPATVHDFDGDDVSEYAVSSASNYSVYELDAAIRWSSPVVDQTGIAAGTAFDFLGDGIAEAMYADENTLFIYDGAGLPLLQVPRSSGTLIEYPVVADIDNDGSAEIVVVSNEGWMHDQTAPLVQVIRDVGDRWIQARRIWNQHTYHVTNVREDGTIPQFEPRHWELLNTFRTNAQIEDGGVCDPEPAG